MTNAQMLNWRVRPPMLARWSRHFFGRNSSNSAGDLKYGCTSQSMKPRLLCWVVSICGFSSVTFMASSFTPRRSG
jgi:hypothetical protein